MSDLITIQEAQAIASVHAPLPAPRVEISIRVATMDDLSFIDSLQKKTSKMVGFMPTKQIEGKIAAGEVLVAESDEATERRSDEGNSRNSDEATERRSDEGEGKAGNSASFPSVASSLRRSVAIRVGYLIASDRYFKRDDVGIIYAINVVPEYRRSLVAASLLKAQFERSAWLSVVLLLVRAGH